MNCFFFVKFVRTCANLVICIFRALQIRLLSESWFATNLCEKLMFIFRCLKFYLELTIRINNIDDFASFRNSSLLTKFTLLIYV